MVSSRCRLVQYKNAFQYTIPDKEELGDDDMSFWLGFLYHENGLYIYTIGICGLDIDPDFTSCRVEVLVPASVTFWVSQKYDRRSQSAYWSVFFWISTCEWYWVSQYSQWMYANEDWMFTECTLYLLYRVRINDENERLGSYFSAGRRRAFSMPYQCRIPLSPQNETSNLDTGYSTTTREARVVTELFCFNEGNSTILCV